MVKKEVSALKCSQDFDEGVGRGQNGVERGFLTGLTMVGCYPGHALAVMSMSVPRYSSSLSQILVVQFNGHVLENQ